MGAPEIKNSTKEEREEFIKTIYRCIADCDSCGICRIFRGMEPETAFVEYINGSREYVDVASDFRR